MLAAALPESATEQASQRTAKAATLRRQLTKIDTAETALISELETPADPGDRAAQALRQRIRARFTDLFTERTRLEAELTALETATTQDNDPALLDELPLLGDVLTGAPDRLIEQLLDAFDVSAVYNNDLHQVTIHATLTDTTPHTIADLLADPRTDQATPPATAPTATEDHFCHSVSHTGGWVMAYLPMYGSWRATEQTRGAGRAPGSARECRDGTGARRAEWSGPLARRAEWSGPLARRAESRDGTGARRGSVGSAAG